MVFSIIFYILFALLLSYLGRMEWVTTRKNYRLTGKINYHWTGYTFMLLFFFILICGLRYQVGVDCESYVETLQTGKPVDSRDSFELFFGWIVNSYRYFGFNRVIYLATLAALEVIPFYYALRKRKFLYPYIGILLILGPFFIYWMNGIRQLIAACFFVLASSFIVEGTLRKKMIASIFIIIAAQFHTSAYVLLLFVCLPAWDIFKNRYFNIAAVLVCAVAGQTDYMNTFMERFIGIEGSGAYALYLERIGIMTQMDTAMGYGPRRIVVLFLTLITLWFAKGMKEKIKDNFVIYSFNLFFIHACLNDNLLSNVHYAFRRPFYYTQPFEMITFAFLLYYLGHVYKGKGTPILYIVSLGLSCLYMIIECIAVANVSGETSLFKFYTGQ